MSYILFGGTFDPIHLGHIKIAREVKEGLKADKVIFIPSKNPRWKDPIDISHRLNMLKLALSEYDDCIISNFEVNSAEKINYSIDTVKHFCQKFKDEKLYFLIGFDQVYKLDKWKDIEDLSKMVQIVAVGRFSCPLNHQMVKKYNVRVVECEELEVSSTAIRELRTLQVPKSVLEYIMEHNLYFADVVKAYYSDKRYEHALSTAWLSYEIARDNYLDPGIAFIAGLLHDVGKEKENQREFIENYYPEYIDYPPVIYHQFISEYIVSNYFKIKDERILEAIRYHTTGNRSMGKYAKIIYAVDKIEPSRGYDSSLMIKAMKDNLSSGFKYVLKENYKYLKSTSAHIDNELSKRCFSYYLKEEL